MHGFKKVGGEGTEKKKKNQPKLLINSKGGLFSLSILFFFILKRYIYFKTLLPNRGTERGWVVARTPKTRLQPVELTKKETRIVIWKV